MGGVIITPSWVKDNLIYALIILLGTSILYENVFHRRGEHGWLMILLLMPPIILVISIAKSFVQSWVNQNDHSEIEK